MVQRAVRQEAGSTHLLDCIQHPTLQLLSLLGLGHGCLSSVRLVCQLLELGVEGAAGDGWCNARRAAGGHCGMAGAMATYATRTLN